MTEPNEQYAYVTFAGDFDPDDISSRIGMAPTESWRKGDINPRTQLEEIQPLVAVFTPRQDVLLGSSHR